MSEMGNLYGNQFFTARSGGARQSALGVLPIVVELINPKSVVDVGCGTGEWLHAVTTIIHCEVVGLDGAYVPTELLAIPRESFVPTDLGRPLVVGRRFDLAISLEVAEHLPPSRAHSFVRDLTELAPAVLFSAAVPGQGGMGHVNEQWQSYWIDLFAKNGFETWDVIRPSVWNRDDVALWYRQNMFLFVDPEVHGHRPELVPTILDLVHPGYFRLAQDRGSTARLWEILERLPRAARRLLARHPFRSSGG